ncbi:MAG: hypothetical protein BRC33_13485 [Cyanobacteria bacterium SW_9_44_58]|nr:MAG: hypothetical protein BRC33_13485 [Cyanobacteria bacterium SW_9_44_58]
MVLLTKSQRLFQIIPCVSLIWTNLATVAVAQSFENNPTCEITPSDEFQTGFQIQALDTEEENIVSALTPSVTEMTIPSLWWAVEQFNPLDGKLVTNWEANKTTKVIRLIVNNRFWRTLDYIDRYSFVNKFGTMAREYNYNLKVITQQKDCLALYTCNWKETSPNCRIEFDVNFN